MKILKHGGLQARKFVCRICGCEFIADATEYSVINSRGIALWYEANCPDCTNITDTSEPWEEENEAGI